MQHPMNRYEEGQMILIDKPLKWTSFDVVRKIRRLTGAKTGHAGTLDPLATGLLIVCTGRMTRKISEYQAREKTYTGTFTLGATTLTYDLESEPVYAGDHSLLTPEQLRQATVPFLGKQLQMPPAHAAIKKNGTPVYRLARKGIAVELEPRPVEITVFELTRIALPEVDFRVVCSTGTYIRSLAHDFGQALGCGAHLSALRRTHIGDFSVEEAVTPDEFARRLQEEETFRTDNLPRS
ncbi:tRNA pseudouridine(55) synthase TruB [Compostibacter hankyongensis]|uniref:tRNA pseudouridine synthase B n=1 Tax=Compostibacter hankyongensis TaxID=1007089 RepID=A0ABP8FXG4_9BACT